MIRLTINNKLIDPKDFVERCSMDSALKACRAGVKGEHEYWKNFRDAECILSLLMGQCFECDQKAVYLYDKSHGNKDYYALRCEEHKPFCDESHLEKINDQT